MIHGHDIGSWIAIVLSVVCVVLFLWTRLQKSHQPAWLFARWIFTAILLTGLFRQARHAVGFGMVVGVVSAWVCGTVLAIIWVPSIVDIVGRRVGALYDGGDDEVEAKPFYSAAQAQRAKGNYAGALAEVRKQLEKFPGDFEGMMLLSALQAENLNDLPGAEVTVEQALAQPGRAPANIGFALNRLADWHLQLTKDRDSAMRALEKIIQLLPDTEFSLQAAQRIARLADTEMLLAPLERPRFKLMKGVDNVGLLRDQESLKHDSTEDQGQLVAKYVKHLEAHPLDSLVREQLAILYAHHYQRLDLATDQLEEVIKQPKQPLKQVVKCLNLLADLQVQLNADPEEVRHTLLRIINLDKKSAFAQNARRRLDVLNLELKAKQAQSQTVKMGTYEQNIGLKGRRNHI